MDREHVIYAVYMVFFAILVGVILITPFLAFSRDMGFMYDAFSHTCHQKLSRSLCVFSDGQGFWVADCIPQKGEYVAERADRTEIRVETDGQVGYKMPVCSRDVGLYAALLLGGAAYPIFREFKDKSVYPAIYLIIAIVPLGLDGGLQLLSDTALLPIVYESTNAMRLLTGVIAGLVSAFYAIPVLMNMFSED